MSPSITIERCAFNAFVLLIAKQIINTWPTTIAETTTIITTIAATYLGSLKCHLEMLIVRNAVFCVGVF